MKESLKSLLSDSEVMAELRNKSESLKSLEGTAFESAPGALESLTNTPPAQLESLLESAPNSVTEQDQYTAYEAIVLLRGRPALLIQDGIWQDPDTAEIRGWLGDPRDGANKLAARIPSVGRIELANQTKDYCGTGWMIDEDVLITNRHVAELFGLRKGGSFDFRKFPDGGPYQPRVDFKREYERDAFARAEIQEIVFMEELGDVRPDMALLRLSRNPALPKPIELDDANLSFDPQNRAKLAVVGYPAEDPRNDAFAAQGIFGTVYRVKRLSPGRLRGVATNGRLLMHDCTTLGGNSGSPIINLETGKACGLHFSGDYLVNNVAITVAALKSRLQDLSSKSIFVPQLGAAPAAPSQEATQPVEHFSGRRGYNPEFLKPGDAQFEVPMPEIGDSLQQFIAPVKSGGNELKYTHFSIVMRADRRLPFFTACNIDGDKAFDFKRKKDVWFIDERVDENAQSAERLYRGNNLDRGHLVRRLDPAWGDTREEASQAELDTFMMTNCSPQHSNLNQKTWLSLEDYILEHADTLNFKATVFTGPVMADTDMEYRGFRIPNEFWKVAVMVNSSTGQLSATGYLLSQNDFLKNIEFVFGEFKTYQVSIEEIEKRTGLKFGLSDFDPLKSTETLPFREVTGGEDLIL